MIFWASFPVFAVAAALIIIAPGPDTIYIMARSIGQGRPAGMVSAVGIFCGLMAHLTLATLGLSAILASSPLLFDTVKFAGAGYLAYLGVRLLLSREPAAHLDGLPKSDLRTIFRQGLVTNLLNPKVALFFIAFLPQFVSASLGHIPLQIATLGLIFSVAGTTWNLCTATAAGVLGAFLRNRPVAARLQQRLTGAVFVGLGVRMALIGRG